MTKNESTPLAGGATQSIQGSGRLESNNLPAGNQGQTTISSIDPGQLSQTPENWDVYRWDAADDPSFLDLIESVSCRGVLEPLVISKDNYVLSGHRRLRATLSAGVESVPIIIEDIEIGPMDSEDRIKLLIQHNKGSRQKTQEEIMREKMAEADPDKAIREAEERRVDHLEASELVFQHAEAEGAINRSDPRRARAEMYREVVSILKDFVKRKFAPVSVRAVHYRLLAAKVRTSTYKSGHVYGSAGRDSGILSKLVTDARSLGLIPDTLISDETRPTYEQLLHETPADYLTDHLESVLSNYWADPHADQESHVEILVEKNTIFPLIRSKVAVPMRMPVSSGRGYSSYSQRARIHERFKTSGKENLVIIYVGDHDPEGIDMPKALVKYFENDFGTRSKVVRAAVTLGQIERHNLPPDIEAKVDSTRFKTYVRDTGMTDAWEVDSMDPEILVNEVTAACKSVIDLDLFNAAMEQEKEDDVRLATLKKVVVQCIKDNAGILNREGNSQPKRRGGGK